MILGAPQVILGAPQVILGAPQVILGVPQVILGVPQAIPGVPQVILGVPKIILGVPKIILGAQIKKYFYQIKFCLTTISLIHPKQYLTSKHLLFLNQTIQIKAFQYVH